MKNSKGFTLVELLATITILGILMIVAIPAVNRIIESSRRDTFLNTAKTYVNAVKNEVAADNIKCTYTLDGSTVTTPISAIAPGYYGIVKIDTTTDAGQALLEEGGKSPWGSKDVRGIVLIRNLHTTEKYEYYIMLVDSDGRGIGTYKTKEEITPDARGYADSKDKKVVQVIQDSRLTRANVYSKDGNNRKVFYTEIPSLTINAENAMINTSTLYSYTGKDASTYPFAVCQMG